MEEREEEEEGRRFSLKEALCQDERWVPKGSARMLTTSPLFLNSVDQVLRRIFEQVSPEVDDC